MPNDKLLDNQGFMPAIQSKYTDIAEIEEARNYCPL